jgi:hypothetical protein
MSFTYGQKSGLGLPTKKGEALRLGFALLYVWYVCIPRINVGLESGYLIIGHGWREVVIIFEYLREYVYDGFPLRISHRVHCCIRAFCHQLMLQLVALSVAANYSTRLPECDFIKELGAANAYLAHE